MFQYARELGTYWRGSRRTIDFLRVMRVRLSQSRLGPLVCRTPIVVRVDIPALGGEVVLRSHTTDISVLDELIGGDSYAPLASDVSTRVSTIIDLGANTGLAARWLLNRNPGAQIVCVEPEAGNATVLRENLRAFSASATVYEACIGAYERQVGLHSDAGEFAFRMVEASDDHPSFSPVDVITMDTVLMECGIGQIDLLKCDIEGAEQELFSACTSWIHRVERAVVECHGTYDGPTLIDELARNGANFEIVHRDLNPAFDCEIVTLQPR